MGELERLADRATRGDDEAIDELLASQLPALRAFLRLRMGPALRARESASDLVQSVCREILANTDRFQFRGQENFKRWLFTTALRVVRNKAKYWQREKRAAAHEEKPRTATGSQGRGSFSDCYRTLITPSREALAKEEVARFEAAFEALPEDHREVISLSRIVGLSHKEIGEQMGRSEEATRQLLRRALARLAMELGPRPPGAGTR